MKSPFVSLRINSLWMDKEGTLFRIHSLFIKTTDRFYWVRNIISKEYTVLSANQIKEMSQI